MLGDWKNLHEIEIEGTSSTSALERAKNPHDVFINLDGLVQLPV